MKNRKGFTLIGLLGLVITILFMLSWLWNAYKVSECDFEAPYRCEVIHGVGLIVPPLSFATVWFDTDKE